MLYLCAGAWTTVGRRGAASVGVGARGFASI
ncbi:hypothetical protein AX774_g6782, partial [Zancudomyces culisetae]